MDNSGSGKSTFVASRALSEADHALLLRGMNIEAAREDGVEQLVARALGQDRERVGGQPDLDGLKQGLGCAPTIFVDGLNEARCGLVEIRDRWLSDAVRCVAMHGGKLDRKSVV